MSKELLGEGELPLVEVALACGFAGQSHFGRVFAQVVRTAPGTWQRRQRMPPLQRRDPEHRHVLET